MQIENSTKREKDFVEWILEKKVHFNFNIKDSDESILRLLENHSLQSIFSESDAKEVRTKLTEFLQNRDVNISFAEYLSVVQILLCYAEYLDIREIVDQLGLSERDKMKDSLTIAYCLSRTNMMAIEALGFSSYKEAFQKTSDILDQKPNTIKNMRDEFDPHFDNGRVGWYQREISPSRKVILDLYSGISDQILICVVEYILFCYKQIQKEAITTTRHKTIRIRSNQMREIKPK